MSKSVDLLDAVNDVHSLIKSTLGSQIKEKYYTVVTEIAEVNYKNYGGFFYAKGIDNKDRVTIQMIIPIEFSGEIKVNHIYKFTGAFEFPNNINFGFLQFRAISVDLTGASHALMAKKETLSKIVEDGLLNKYKNDFLSFNGKDKCKVALVTSKNSQVIEDVRMILKDRRGIWYDLIHVNLLDEVSIADGLRTAEEGQYDVVMMVRGGGREKDFEVFNSVTVIEQIKNMQTPIILGLGHSSNITLADKIADRSETTPTKAAKFLVDVLGDKYNNQPKQYYNNYYKKKVPKSSNTGCLTLIAGLLAIVVVALSL